ncbi:hypothetical protein GCM10010970_17350 [Silvimonas iriomotensis]|uniref:K(+)-transporting ATPase subunit F n=1 Tax=Silvimonas iriomotensis TaxID=449662 RepID=A0ABQ2P995_9NEIS|nr:hypothetical protein GCM10010970_17350 [Silvimonas iriomotensis]
MSLRNFYIPPPRLYPAFISSFSQFTVSKSPQSVGHSIQGERHGRRVSAADRRLLCGDSGAGGFLQASGGAQMNWLYLMAAAVFVLLLVYLVYALFNAEDVA